MQAVREEELASKVNKQEEFLETFGKSGRDTETPEVFLQKLVVWEEYLHCYEVYGILRNYLSETNALDSNLLLELIKGRGLPLEETLDLIPYIHSGFLSIINRKAKVDGNK